MLKFHSNKQKKDDGVGDMATHHFQVELAKEYGLVPAILLENIYFWVEKNRANEQHFHDGRYWTYNSMKAYTELFPYMGEKQVRNALKKLKDDGLIVVGNFNKSAYDQTKWYALTEKGIQAVEKKGQTAFAQKANGKVERANRKGEWTNDICPNAEPIPDNKTQIINTDDINTDNKTNSTSDKSDVHTISRNGNDNTEKKQKHKYGEYSHVLLTDREFELLTNDYGDEMTGKLIKTLDEAIEMKGYKYKSCYLAIKKWVVDAVKKSENQGNRWKTEEEEYQKYIDSWRNA